jgi:RNA recognition motif-containing protein
VLASLRPRDYERSRTISSKVFVGNLAFQSTKEELQELLSAAGTIRDVYLPSDRATGRPRGFAFVEFTTDQEAQAAIEQFNDYEFAGRKLRVNSADDRPRARSPRPPRSFEPNFGQDDYSERPAKPKGSRRGMRGKKRSL